MKVSLKNILESLISPFIVLMLWELSSQVNYINPLYFPAPTTILSKLYDLLGNDTFLMDTYMSLKRLTLGTFFGVSAGISLALAMHLSRFLKKAMLPLIALTYPIPKLAVFPLILVILGVGDSSKIAIITLGVFYLVLLNTLHGLERLKSNDFLDIAKIYKIPPIQYVFNILLRGALPEIITGVKLGLGYGLVMVVASEFTVSKNGIGFFMWNAWDQFRIIDLYCGLAVLSFLGLIFFQGLDFLKNNLKELK